MAGAVVWQFMAIHPAVTVTAKDQRKLTATGSAPASVEKFLKPVEASTFLSADVPSDSFTDAYHLTSRRWPRKPAAQPENTKEIESGRRRERFLVRKADSWMGTCVWRQGPHSRQAVKNGARRGQLRSQADSRGTSVSLMEADTVNPEETSRTRQR